MSETPVERARFTPLSGPEAGQPIPVHFNPASLQYTVSSTLKEEGTGNTAKQYVSQSSARLAMDVVFDTTHDGTDVRAITERVARLMEPAREAGGRRDVPPVVEFAWGLYVFRGMVERYTETLDFFAASGVPLRASLNLTLARQDEVFAPGREELAAGLGAGLGAVVLPAGLGGDPASAAARAGDPRGAREVAVASGAESLRFAAGASLTVGAAVAIGPPVAFAGGAGLSLGAGVSAGAGVSLGAPGAGAGAAASAGVGASAGAFAGLRLPEPRRPAALHPERLLPRTGPPRLDVTTAASVSLTGQAVIPAGGGSLAADVGARASLRARLTFDESV